MEKASMVTDKRKLVVVDNFDIEDIKKNVGELLSYCLIYPSHLENKISQAEFNVLCIGNSVCLILSVIPVLVITGAMLSIVSGFACFCLLSIIWNIIFFSILRYYIDEWKCKPFRQEAENALKEIRTLEGAMQVVDAICRDFYDYSFSKAPTNISFYDLRTLRRNLENYFDIRNSEILSASLSGKTLYIDLQGNDGFVEKMEIAVEPKEKVGAEGPSILFENWCTPTYVRMYNR